MAVERRGCAVIDDGAADVAAERVRADSTACEYERTRPQPGPRPPPSFEKTGRRPVLANARRAGSPGPGIRVDFRPLCQGPVPVGPAKGTAPGAAGASKSRVQPRAPSRLCALGSGWSRSGAENPALGGRLRVGHAGDADCLSSFRSGDSEPSRTAMSHHIGPTPSLIPCGGDRSARRPGRPRLQVTFGLGEGPTGNRLLYMPAVRRGRGKKATEKTRPTGPPAGWPAQARLRVPAPAPVSRVDARPSLPPPSVSPRRQCALQSRNY